MIVINVAGPSWRGDMVAQGLLPMRATVSQRGCTHKCLSHALAIRLSRTRARSRGR